MNNQKPRLLKAKWTIEKAGIESAYYAGKWPKLNDFMKKRFPDFWLHDWVVKIRKKLGIWSSEDDLVEKLAEDFRARSDEELIAAINKKWEEVKKNDS